MGVRSRYPRAILGGRARTEGLFLFLPMQVGRKAKMAAWLQSLKAGLGDRVKMVE